MVITILNVSGKVETVILRFSTYLVLINLTGSLILQTFVDKLKELHVSYCICDHEADQQLASLASQWNCSLVSNDSDFLLHDLPGGVILIRDLNVKDILEQDGM